MSLPTVYFKDFNPLRWWQHLMNTKLYIGYKSKSYEKKQEKKNESTLLYQLDYLCKVSHILLLLIQLKLCTIPTSFSLFFIKAKAKHNNSYEVGHIITNMIVCNMFFPHKLRSYLRVLIDKLH